MAHIDVLLPVKNCYDYLAEAIESIINQTYPDWRLIVLDHGSTDGSFEMAQRYSENDERVQIYRFEDAVGLSGLLNRGLDLCDCEFVMRHDADDVAFPDRMERTLNAFAKHAEIDVIGGHAIRIDASGKQTGLIKVPTDKARLQAAFFFKNPIIHPTATLRFSTIKSMGIRYGIDFINILPEQERLIVSGLAEDYYLFGQLGVLGKCLNLDEVLIKYRWHGGNVGAKKVYDQIKISIDISRYLASCFCSKNNITKFDPAPFCTYGGTLLMVNPILTEKLSLSFQSLSNDLNNVMGRSDGLSRELAFRKVLSTRNSFLMLLNYFLFRLRFRPDNDEWYSVKAWMTRWVKKRVFVRID